MRRLLLFAIGFAATLAFGAVVLGTVLDSEVSTAFNQYQNYYVATSTVFDNEPLNGAATADTSNAVLLTGPKVGNGYWSVWIDSDEDTGSSDFTVTYQLSMDGTNWAYESGIGATTTLVSNFSGTDLKVYLLQPMAAIYVRFIVTAEAGNGADIDVYLSAVKHPL